MARYEVRERKNSPWFPFAVFDTASGRQVALTVNEYSATKEARRKNREAGL